MILLTADGFSVVSLDCADRSPSPQPSPALREREPKNWRNIMTRLLIVWVLNAVALMAVAYLMPSIKVTSFMSALIAAFALGFVNTLIRPLLALLTLPISVLTLGFFYLVLNGLLFWMVGKLLNGFSVDGFWAAVFGGLLYGLISWLLALIIPFGKKS
jgi:putative membrane protein